MVTTDLQPAFRGSAAHTRPRPDALHVPQGDGDNDYKKYYSDGRAAADSDSIMVMVIMQRLFGERDEEEIDEVLGMYHLKVMSDPVAVVMSNNSQ